MTNLVTATLYGVVSLALAALSATAMSDINKQLDYMQNLSSIMQSEAHGSDFDLSSDVDELRLQMANMQAIEARVKSAKIKAETINAEDLLRGVK